MARFCSHDKTDVRLSNGDVSRTRKLSNGRKHSDTGSETIKGSSSSSKKNGFSYHDPVTGKIWKKVLYQQNPFPDNYTPDECFLAAIEKNKNLHKYTFRQCLQGSCQVNIIL
jgi:hypothetical protein